jgi:putative radical SAM enzyme (TIGR03279 family)
MLIRGHDRYLWEGLLRGELMKQPGGVIAEVEPGSLGEAIGLRPGDRLLAINDRVLRDVIDVQYYGADERLAMLVERDGQRQVIAIERDYGDDLGLTFASLTFDVDIRRCANNCDFCFVKQNAPHMRRSLYVKDDDYRYSFLSGSFVTLTNLDEDDWARLEEQRLSPLYVSVHATEPELRRRFLRRRSAPDILEQLRRLAGLGIEVHAQAVLVPGVNDGEHLARTVADLTAMFEEPVVSISVVPIGLTRYHRGACRPYRPDEARAVLDQVEPWRAENRATRGQPFVYPSDEWYLVAGRPIPPAEDYHDFPQVENGVGMVRQLLDEWQALTVALPRSPLRPATLACGTLIAPVLGRIVEELNGLTGSSLTLVTVANGLFGAPVSVSGLLGGQDVVAALRGRPLGERVILPRAMFTGRYGAGDAPPGTTLDDMSVEGLAEALGVPVAMAGTVGEVVEHLVSPYNAGIRAEHQR